ncbi:MAG TPA: YciI family protein [Phycisphaerales bacterium]|nr:YciI family protein [Phycisphaerales bacterium]
MRVMVIVKATKDSEAGVMPGRELLEAMGKFNEELVRAGIMIDGAGLRPSRDGARVRFSGPERTARRGPFPDDGLVAGYWVWQVRSLDEAIEWLKKCPNPHPQDCEVEIRPLMEESDFEIKGGP